MIVAQPLEEAVLATFSVAVRRNPELHEAFEIVESALYLGMQLMRVLDELFVVLQVLRWQPVRPNVDARLFRDFKCPLKIFEMVLDIEI
tara:strand:+ start:668 stop:934 length:267 start_codon:yes stop_codon:yes gene_type:complete